MKNNLPTLKLTSKPKPILRVTPSVSQIKSVPFGTIAYSKKSGTNPKNNFRGV